MCIKILDCTTGCKTIENSEFLRKFRLSLEGVSLYVQTVPNSKSRQANSETNNLHDDKSGNWKQWSYSNRYMNTKLNRQTHNTNLDDVSSSGLPHNGLIYLLFTST